MLEHVHPRVLSSVLAATTVLTVALLAGCTSLESDPGQRPTSPATEPGGSEATPGGADIEQTNETPQEGAMHRDVRVVMNESGGLWMIAYHPFAGVVANSFEYEMDYTFQTKGKQPAFFWPPTFTQSIDGAVAVTRAGTWGAAGIKESDGAGVTVSWQGSVGASMPAITGVFFAAFADDPWSLNMEIRFVGGVGPATGIGPPAFLSTGWGASVAIIGESVAGMPTPIAGQSSIAGRMESPGWFHLQLLYASIQPDGVQDYSWQLPDGTSYDGIGTKHGYDLNEFGLGGSVTKDGWIDLVGNVKSPPGEFSASVTQVESNHGLRFAVAFIPLDEGDLPPGLAAFSYWDTHRLEG